MKPNGFNDYYHDYDFDQFWDYEIPLFSDYYTKYSGVLQNVYNEMLGYLRFFAFNLAESTQVKWYNVFVSILLSL